MIDKVIIYNTETREGHEREGQTQKVELTGKQFGYLLRSNMSFPEFFGYINSVVDWEDVEKE